MGPKNPPIQKKFKKKYFWPLFGPIKNVTLLVLRFFQLVRKYCRNTVVRLQLILFSKDIGAF
jgi:hypothetical protein